MLMDTDFKDSLINAQSVEEFMDLINQKEAAQKAKEEEKEEAQKEFTGTYRLLAVTACPTGIAHTYMSAEALEEKVKQMGITIIVETDGSGGTKNAPTAKEIEECEAIIVAADKNVEMARFDGKPVIQVKVADGINKAEELINEALSGNAPIYHADHGDGVRTRRAGLCRCQFQRVHPRWCPQCHCPDGRPAGQHRAGGGTV